MTQNTAENISEKRSVGERKDHLITLLGPASAGKTSLTAALKAELENNGTRAPNLAKSKENQSEAQKSVLEGFFAMKCCSVMLSPTASVVLADSSSNFEDLQESTTWAALSDLTLVVVDANPEHLSQLAPYLHVLSELGKPHALFVNKVDSAEANIDALISNLSQMSAEKLLVQQYPLYSGNRVKGLVHLWNEEVCQFTENGEKISELGAAELLEASVARQKYLESLADYDDLIFAELLEERLPSVRAIADDLRENFATDSFVPIFFGNALRNQGLKHLAEFVKLALEKAPTLEHHKETVIGGSETDSHTDFTQTELVCLQNGVIRKRGPATAFRVKKGQLTAGQSLFGQRFGSLFKINGGVNELTELSQAGTDESGHGAERNVPLGPGSIFYALKVEPRAAGTVLVQNSKETIVADCINRKNSILSAWQNRNYQQAIRCIDSTPPEKLIEAIDTLSQENEMFQMAKTRSEGRVASPSSRTERSSQIVVDFLGTRQAETLKQLLVRRYGISIELVSPPVPYRERISKRVERVHGRYKHQNGGHGAFGDVYFNFEPLPTGSGIQFEEQITGGSVPKQYFGAIEQALYEALRSGKQGFEIDDLKATLVDGSYHSVDSSELAFRNATRLAVARLLEICDTIVLEPYLQVNVQTPETLISQVVQTVPGHRGHIQELRSSDGSFLLWSSVRVHLPQAEHPSFVRRLQALCQGAVFLKAEPLEPHERYKVLQNSGAMTRH